MTAVSQQIIDAFPAFAAIAQIPEVADLLTKASQGGWSSAYFQEQLWNTQWWKTTPETARTWQTRKLVLPAQRPRVELQIRPPRSVQTRLQPPTQV